VLVGSGPSRASAGHDQSGFVWFIEWIARSIAHLRDPLSTVAIYAPHGWNLAWATSIPGPAAMLTPVTLLAGPIVSYDVLALIAPALSAWAAYLLCREATRRSDQPAVTHAAPPAPTGAPVDAPRPPRLLSAAAAPAIAGGLLFGFGSYETAETINHPNLAFVALVPTVALLVLRRHRARMSRPRFILALGAVLAAQMLTSTEILATTVMFGAIALALWGALLRGPAARAVAHTAVEAAASLGVAAVLGAPFLYQAFHFGNPVQALTEVGSGLDLANLLTATRATLLPGVGAIFWSARRMHSTLTEQGAYLGLPLIVMLGAFGWSFRRTLAGRWLIAFIACVLVLALGGWPIVQGLGFPSIPLPWRLIGQLPLLRFAVPSRFTLYLWLALAVAGSLWLADGLPARSLLRWALLALVAVSLMPSPASTLWSTNVDRPALLHSHALARYVPQGSTVLALPYGSQGDSMLWQVEAGFAYRMAGGYASFQTPPDYMRFKHLLHALSGNAFKHQLTPRLCAFLRYTGATAILLRDGARGSWRQLLHPLGVTPIAVGGFHVYRLAGSGQTLLRCGFAGS